MTRQQAHAKVTDWFKRVDTDYDGLKKFGKVDLHKVIDDIYNSLNNESITHDYSTNKSPHQCPKH